MSVTGDRIEFAHSISYPEQDQYVPGIVVFFDEIMWLYGVAGLLDLTSISVNNDEQATYFDISCTTPYQLEKLDMILKENSSTTIYGKTFLISSTHTTETSMNVRVQQCA